MDILVYTAIAGGLFALLVFWHFLSDWVFQSQKEALAKATNWRVRARHVTVYTVLFIPLLMLLSLRVGHSMLGDDGGMSLEIGPRFYLSLAILWGSHFFIDTYWPVMMWAKYLRRAPQFQDVVKPVWVPIRSETVLPSGQKVIGIKLERKPRPGWSDKVVDRITYDSDVDAFKAFFGTPVGAILCITMDQLCHIACLLPVAWLMMP